MVSWEAAAENWIRRSRNKAGGPESRNSLFTGPVEQASQSAQSQEQIIKHLKALPAGNNEKVFLNSLTPVEVSKIGKEVFENWNFGLFEENVRLRNQIPDNYLVWKQAELLCKRK